MNQPILITGASGVLGRALVNALVSGGLAVRQAVRNPEKAPSGETSVRFDYHVSSTIAPALSGARGLLLISPSLEPDAPALLRPVVECAKASGVQHIVFISAFGANFNEQAPLRVVEHIVMDSGVPYTILRPNFFMENFSEGFLAGGIKGTGGIHLAAGDGKTSFISVRDIAAVALAVFRDSLTGKELDLTGPEALDHLEAAKIVSEVSDRAVAYHALTEEQMVDGARGLGMPESAIGYLTVLYSVVRAGYAAPVTPVVEQVVGRKPITFRAFAQANVAAWK
ncbi:SDR family oxidoreductase [Paludibaculum fermentans]|uniref:SDR family oxidoreductase n=1 Tax=Paludibaculum fermentans TaxID=1473598 RepID=UPI003EB79F02